MRIPTVLIGIVAMLAAGPAGCADEPAAPAQDARQVPLWKLPPDKPAGPTPPAVEGRRRSFSLVRLAGGFEQPNQVVARHGDDRLFVVEQAGVIRTLPGRRRWLDVRDRTEAVGEQGLLSLAFDRQHAYLLLTTPGDGDTRVLQVPVTRSGRPEMARARTVLAVEQPYENHKGGTLLVDERGRIVVGLGDGGSAFDPQQRGQEPRDRLGKILRWDPTQAEETPEWSVVAIGLRNPFRMSFDPATGRLWLGDVGQDRVEEVDAFHLPETGVPVPNLGWAAYEGHLPLGRKRLQGSRESLTWPVASYRHRGGHCSVTGGHVARGPHVPDRLRGRYVFGDFCRGTIWSLDARGVEDRDRLDLRREVARLPGLVSFGEDRRGRLLAVSIQGDILRLVDPDRGGR